MTSIKPRLSSSGSPDGAPVHPRRLSLLFVLLLAGCPTQPPATSPDLGEQPAADLAAVVPFDAAAVNPPDQAAPQDLAAAPDLTAVVPADLVVAPDLAAALRADLVVLPDLTAAVAADLVMRPDLASAPDLSMQPPDLTTMRDLQMAPDLCKPEVCNGIDDDCDGKVDDGCPTAIVMSNVTGTSSRYGGNGGDAFDDSCPLGQAIVGLSGDVGGNIDRVTAMCGTLGLVEDWMVRPYAYSVTVGPGSTLQMHGQNVSTQFQIRCPANQLVTAVSGEAGMNGVSKIRLVCAPLLVMGDADAFSLVFGPTTTVRVEGTNVYPAFSYSNAGVGVMDRIFGRAGAWLDAVGFGERLPALTLRCQENCPVGASCVNGACVCQGNLKPCNGVCVDLTTPKNCGACGNACPEVCEMGKCVPEYEWAKWKMPNPAGAGLPNPAQYDTSTPGIVVDKVTGLVWQRSEDGMDRTRPAASSYCANLALAGGGWRLPKVIELSSLQDFTRGNPSIDPNAFPNTPVGGFWTSTLVAGDSDLGWGVNFKWGAVSHYVERDLLRVRCVR